METLNLRILAPHLRHVCSGFGRWTFGSLMALFLRHVSLVAPLLRHMCSACGCALLAYLRPCVLFPSSPFPPLMLLAFVLACQTTSGTPFATRLFCGTFAFFRPMLPKHSNHTNKVGRPDFTGAASGKCFRVKAKSAA